MRPCFGKQYVPHDFISGESLLSGATDNQVPFSVAPLSICETVNVALVDSVTPVSSTLYLSSTAQL